MLSSNLVSSAFPTFLVVFPLKYQSCIDGEFDLEMSKTPTPRYILVICLIACFLGRDVDKDWNIFLGGSCCDFVQLQDT